MPALIVVGILVGAWLAGKHFRDKPTLSIDAQEALAPAPFSTEGGAADDLTPGDINNSFVILDAPATDGTAPNLLWNWEDPSKPERHYRDPRKDKPRTFKRGTPDEMRIGTCNIKNFPDMSPAKVEADGRTAGQHCTLWGGQEIQPHEDAPVVLKGLRSLSQPWDAVLTEWAEPIFYRTDLWEPFDTYHVPEPHPPALPGAHGLWDAITSSAFNSKKHPDLKPFAVVNCHLIVGAYNGKHSAHDRAILKTQWAKEWADFKAVINYHHSKGRTVFFMGDFNRALPPAPFRGCHYLNGGHAGIDHLGVMGNSHSVKFRVKGNPLGERIQINSDHDLRAIRGSLTNA